MLPVGEGHRGELGKARAGVFKARALCCRCTVWWVLEFWRKRNAYMDLVGNINSGAVVKFRFVLKAGVS